MARVSLADFINGVFKNRLDEEEVFLTRQHVEKNGRWLHKPLEELSSLPPDKNAFYYCISSVTPRENNQIKRESDDFAGLFVIVLDDVGEKVEANDLEPSYIIETSKGSEQWGYILTEPVRSKTLAKKLIKAVYSKKSGLTDSGGNIIMKLVKLPYGINVKAEKDYFPTTLKKWSPQITYTYEDLIDEWSLSLDEADFDTPTVQTFPDELLTYLQGQKAILKPQNTSGWFTVECPLGHDHSDGNLEAYYAPLGSGSDPLRRQFKCHHEHDGNPPDTRDFILYHQECGGPKVDIVGPPEMFIKGDESFYSQPIPKEHFPIRTFTRQGHIKVPGVHENFTYLMNWYRYEVYYDLILKEVIMKTPMMDTDGYGLSNDALSASIMSHLKLCDVPIGAQERRSYIAKTAMENKYNFVTDYFRELPPYEGDPIRKLASMVRTTSETPDELKYYFIKKWLVQCVAAADYGRRSPLKTSPKFESVLVFSGNQGIGKTRWFNSLIPYKLRKYFMDGAVFDPKNKDHLDSFTTKWVVELGELDATFKRADIESLKAFLSQDNQTYRKAYGEYTGKYERRTSFCASVNGEHFLNDPTGNRRFWPVSVESIELPSQEFMDQVWSQVWQLYLGGESWWFDSDERGELVRQHTSQFNSVNSEPVIEALITEFGDLTYEDMTGIHTTWMPIKELVDMLGFSDKYNIGMGRKLVSYLKGKAPSAKKSADIVKRSAGLNKVRLPNQPLSKLK